MRRILQIAVALALVASMSLPAAAAATGVDCAQTLHATSSIAFASWYWSIGLHEVTFRYTAGADSDTVESDFSVSPLAPLHPGYVVIRNWGLQAIDAPDTVIPDSTFNPAQPTRTYAGWTFDPGTIAAAALDELKSLKVEFSVDGAPFVVDPTVNLSSYCDTGPTTLTNDTWHNSGIFHRA
jgi:hypothetical protein